MNKNKLINALRTVADKLSTNSVSYDWYQSDKCNCGLLARELIRPNPLIADVGSWRSRSHSARQCEATGLPYTEIFNQLMVAGLEWKDFGEIESLSNPAVCARIGVTVATCCWVTGFIGADKHGDFIRQNPSWVIKYFRAWADMMEEEQWLCEPGKPWPSVEVPAFPPCRAEMVVLMTFPPAAKEMEMV